MKTPPAPLDGRGHESSRDAGLRRGCIIRSGQRYGLLLMLVMLIVMRLCACTSLQTPPVAGSAQSRQGELKTWQDGVQAFHEGAYEKAQALFEMLSEHAELEGLRRQALFALAAARLMLAQTPEEFSQALYTWDCWSQQFPPDPAAEDPRMLTPFLQRLSPPGSSEGQLKESPAPVKKIILHSPAACKDLVQAKDKEIDRMKAKLDAREKEVRRLKHQIDSLEAIHLKFQERKQGVSSP